MLGAFPGRHGVIPAQLISLAETVAGVYGALLATYFATGLIVTRLNRKMPARKIQLRIETRAQIRRDQRQSVVSLAVIAALFGCGQWSHAALGWGFPAPSGIAGIVLSFIASLLLFDAWFYWLHRLIHTRSLYGRVHSWHHQTVTPEVWSNNSDRAVDNLFLQSYWLVAHFLIPIAPAVLFAHKLYDQVTGELGHSGYEYAGELCWPPSPLVTVTHHDQHHRFGACNYGTHFTVWDRLMGTLHPTHDEEARRNIRGAGPAAAPDRL